MTCNILEQQNDTLVSLNQALQDCVATQDIDKALDLALLRKKALIEIFQSAENDPSNSAELEKLATETLERLNNEKMLLKAQSLEKRNDFLLRKSAIKAYMAPIAA